MTALLAGERYKLVRSKPLYVILGCLAATMAIYMLRLYINSTPALGQDAIYMPAWLDMLLFIWFPVFIAYYVGVEFQHKTVNDALCLGKSRWAVYAAKLLTVFAGVAVMTLFVIIGMTVAASVMFGFGDMSLAAYLVDFVKAFALQYVVLCAFASLFAMFAFIAQSPALTVVLGVGYALLSTFILSLLLFLFGDEMGMRLAWGFPNTYFLLINLFGLDGYEGQITGAEFALRTVLMGTAWIAVTTGIGYAIFKKKDLK